MAIAVKLREDFTAAVLRRLAARTKNVNQSRRLLSELCGNLGDDGVMKAAYRGG